MDRAEEPSVGSPSGESKPRTPAYASFDSSTDKLLHVFHAVLRGMQALQGRLRNASWRQRSRVLPPKSNSESRRRAIKKQETAPR